MIIIYKRFNRISYIMTRAIDWEKIKVNDEYYSKEKQRICNYVKERYKNDPEFREKMLQNNRAYRARMKSIKQAEK